MGDKFVTSTQPPAQRLQFWLEVVCNQILPVSIDPRHDRVPQAGMACSTLGSLRIRDVVGGDHVYTRDQACLRRGDPETVQIGTPLQGGSILIQDGREAVLGPGDMVVYDSSRPFTLVMEERFHWQVFLLPKVKLRRPESELAQITAVPLSSERGVARVVFQFLRNLATEARFFEGDPGAAALGENAADLIATMVRSHFGKPWDVADRDAVLLHSVLAFIAEHHADPSLDPALIAHRHGISVRRLHALFERHERSVSTQIRQERLIAIRRDLADPRLAQRPIARIAESHGMVNPSAFARLFRAVEGITPRLFREMALRRT
ncbi:helix-turn-helix domain-containing protein [Sphaerisporangium perillae]|uniref:AraC-like ligand-binding domain-containing protein n=1 Tax=Sphaerisporangium perillae TaxID=2935860 RepID=UPI00200DC64E|nr:helix-turn-helix domain-containing protein [Sphaerisporangium perillae]